MVGIKSSSLDNGPAHPVDHGWAWCVFIASVLASMFWGAVVRGFGVFFVEFRKEFGFTCLTMSFFISVQLTISAVTGFLVTTFGTRILTSRQCVVISGLLFTLSFFITSQSKSTVFLFFSFSVLTGLALAALTGPSVSILGRYFDRRRTVVNGFIQASSGIGALIFAPFSRHLIDKYFLSGALMMTGGILGHLLMAGSLMRPPELYDRWRKLKEKAEKNKIRESLLGPPDSFRPRSPTSDSSFSPLARQAMLQRMRSRTEDEHSPSDDISISGHSTEHHDDEESLYDELSFRFERQEFIYGSCEMGIILPYYQEEHKTPRTRTVSATSNGSCKSEPSTNGKCIPKVQKVKLHETFNISVFKNLTFVLFAIGFSLGAVGTISVLFIPDLARDHGLNNAEAAILVSIFMIGDIGGRWVVGILSYKRVDNLFLIVTSLLCSGVIQQTLKFCDTFSLLAVFSCSVGIFSGPIYVLYASVLCDMFYKKDVKSAGFLLQLTQGIMWSIAIVISGYLRDITNSYILSYRFFGALSIAASLILFLCKISFKPVEPGVNQPNHETGEMECHRLKSNG